MTATDRGLADEGGYRTEDDGGGIRIVDVVVAGGAGIVDGARPFGCPPGGEAFQPSYGVDGVDLGSSRSPCSASC